VYRAVSLTGGLLGGAFVGAVAWLALVPSAGAVLWVDGYEYRVGDLRSPQTEARIRAGLELRAKQQLSKEVLLRADEVTVGGAATDFGYTFDEESAFQQAREALEGAHVSMSENVGIWLARRFSSSAENAHISLRFELNARVAERRLAHLSGFVERPAQDAQMLISEHKIIPSEEGRRLSLEASVVRLAATRLEDAALVDAVVERTRPHVTEDDLAPVDVTRVLAHYETSFRGKAGSRAVNIRAAARYLDGAMILPGEVLSFNERVGRRIHGRGFVDAPVIVNDELEQDVGGGVCQVATTLHAAAVFGNLEVVSRRSHSRPSGYAPLGLDATVLDGKVDLKLRNPFDEPVLVHVRFPSTYTIRVELLGREPDVEVTHGYSVVAREPFARRVWHREDAPSGTTEQKQKGSEGMDVVSVLRVKGRDGAVSQRSYKSKYYPVPEVYWLGEGAEAHSLPEMPEGAVGLVIDGEEREGVVAAEPEANHSDEREPRDTN
jgi:vancomycin resistance protein YoaR